MQIRNVTHDISADKGVSLPMFPNNLAGQSLVEKGADRLYPLLPRHCRHIGGGLNPQVTDLQPREVLDHDAIIAADFDDERIRGFQVILPDMFGKRLKMDFHSLRCARIEGVILIEPSAHGQVAP